MRPRKKVPVVKSAARQKMVSPRVVTTPVTRPSSTVSDAAVSWRTKRFGQVKMSCCTTFTYSARSIWARLERTAGPLRVFRMRNWMPA